MNDLDHYVLDIARFVVLSEDCLKYEWDLISIVYGITDGHTSNSGFLYVGEDIIPTGLDFDDLDDLLYEFREAMAEQTGKKFKQLLIQMERETGRINIEYDFEKGNKWTITAAHLFGKSDELRPKFD